MNLKIMLYGALSICTLVSVGMEKEVKGAGNTYFKLLPKDLIDTLLLNEAHQYTVESVASFENILTLSCLDNSTKGNAKDAVLIPALKENPCKAAELMINLADNKDAVHLKFLTSKGITALHDAVTGNHANRCAIIDFLLSSGDFVDVRDVQGTTPLMQAVSQLDEVIVAKLLKEKANAQAEDAKGRTLDMYVGKGHKFTKPKHGFREAPDSMKRGNAIMRLLSAHGLILKP